MKSQPLHTQSFFNRLLRGQRGNAIVYIFLFAVGWFALFSIKGWIYETKEARIHGQHAEESAQAIYKYNPYRSYR